MSPSLRRQNKTTKAPGIISQGLLFITKALYKLRLLPRNCSLPIPPLPDQAKFRTARRPLHS
uniref:Uncharacterized protein n=1 Tax=Siphoviridae sp. ctv0N24 TaxID=2826509 RepID=A0A8S5N475_9CAUD|nr:MAG TPA: hypothetical protein [Siphoviridae sp. ctv0N24]